MISEKSIIWLEKTDSTNKFIKTLINNSKVKSGTIISTNNQTNGKGQKSNVWLSEPNKNLTFSLYLEIKIRAIHQFYISKIIALSIYDFINKHTKNTKIKWPNDIYINDSKIAGILIENTIQGEFITKSIIGIGININQTEFNKKIPNPISLKAITNQNYNIKTLLVEITEIINSNLKLITNFNTIDKKYNNLLYKLNIESSFYNTKNQKFKGIIIGTEEDGRILIKTGELIKKFGLHEIKYLNS